MTKIGFIGVGVMGAPMVRNLLRAGYEVSVFDAHAAAVEAIAKDGARPCRHAAEVVHGSQCIVTMVTRSADVEQVLFGPDGAYEPMRPGTLYIDMSTIAPATTDSIGRCMGAKGVQMLDAPVGRTSQHAERGESLFMVGGAGATLERARPMLQKLGNTIVHCGPLGSGIRMKIVNNFLASATNVATSEALALAEAAGIDPGLARDTMLRTVAGLGHLGTTYPAKVLAGDLVQALLPLDQGAAAAGPTGLAYVRLVHASTWLWLGRPADALGALPASGSDAGDAVQARAAALRTRLRRLLGEAAAVPEAAAVQAFQRVQASARDGAALAVEWADLLPATQALEGLARARRVALDRGAEGMARSLAVCEVERLLAHDPAAAAVQAATLWRELQGGPHGLHSMSYPPHAWGTLARALRGSDPQAARACRQRALDWIDAAVMPDTSPDTRATFLAGNPFHRALLGRGGGGRTRRRGDRA
jgi:4-hydroxybutyrate dehydrogenase/sulfolactaldehyde 3-reductase